MLTEYIGQEKVKKNLAIFIDAAKGEKKLLGSLAPLWSPGVGKTTLALYRFPGTRCGHQGHLGPVIERPGDLAAILTNLHEHEHSLIDEIHRLSHVVEEILYPAMEDYISIFSSVRDLPPVDEAGDPHFTLIGATTRAGLLTSPCGIGSALSFRFEF